MFEQNRMVQSTGRTPLNKLSIEKRTNIVLRDRSSTPHVTLFWKRSFFLFFVCVFIFLFLFFCLFCLFVLLCFVLFCFVFGQELLRQRQNYFEICLLFCDVDHGYFLKYMPTKSTTAFMFSLACSPLHHFRAGIHAPTFCTDSISKNPAVQANLLLIQCFLKYNTSDGSDEIHVIVSV